MSNKTGGQILIELVLAMGIASILISALVGGLIGVRSGTNLSTNILNANFLFQEAIEAVRSVRESGWNQIASNDTYHPVISGSNWSLVSGSEVVGTFTRVITIDDTRRDTNGNITETGGKVDPSTKKIKLSVSWQGYGSISSINQTFYLSRWQGNTSWIQTTKPEFDQGTKTNVVTTNISGGEVALDPGSGGTKILGNQFIAKANQPIAIQNAAVFYVSHRFTAQNSKTVTQIHLYQTLSFNFSNAVYAVEVRADSGGNPGAILATSTYAPPPGTSSIQTIPVSFSSNPVPIIAGNTYHIVLRKLSGSGIIQVTETTPLNNLIPFDNNPDPNSNVLFSSNSGSSWITFNRQPVYTLVFSDSTSEGNPLATAYDDDSTVTRIYGPNQIGEEITVSGNNKNVTSLSFYVRRISGKPDDHLYVAIRKSADNSDLLLPNTILVENKDVKQSYDWYTVNLPSTVPLLSGEKYRLVLSSPNTPLSKAYVLSAQSILITHLLYTRITYDGTNSVYTRSNNSGQTWVNNINRDVPFRYSIEGSIYQSSGTFESSTFGSLGVNRGFNYLSWVANKPASTDIKFQVATSNSDGPIWNFIGPDSSAATYFINSGSIPLELVSASFIRYKAFLTGDGNNTPTLEEATINWSP